MAPSSASAAPLGGNIRVYIDNSNLLILGKRTWAEKKGYDERGDPTWRFDIGALKTVLLEESGLTAEEKVFTLNVNLYGSKPPPVDTVWKAIESHGVKVTTFWRSKWTGREKEVDGKIIADSVRDACEDSSASKAGVFIIVSGDRDLDVAVQTVIEKGFRVHMWSWKKGLAAVYKRREESRVQVHYLDDFMDDFGFNRTVFRVGRNKIDLHSIVIMDALSEAHGIEEFRSRLRFPTYSYVTGNNHQDLVLIPVWAKELSSDEKTELFFKAKEAFRTYEPRVFTYQGYLQQQGRGSDVVLETSNRFQELSVGEYGEDDGGDDDDDDYDDTTMTAITRMMVMTIVDWLPKRTAS